MKTQTTVQGVLAALGLGLVATAADAVNITIEPDNYVGVIGNVAPGAQLSTYRLDPPAAVPTFAPVLSVSGSTWAPTGVRVFGHKTIGAGETPHHWDNLLGAYDCEHDASCVLKFYVFRVDFTEPTTRTTIRTTMRGEMATDGAELWALDRSGERILRCRIPPVDFSVVLGAAQPDVPRYVLANGMAGKVCGKLLKKQNCAAPPYPGDCEYIYEASVIRRERDIQYVWFGGLWHWNSWAPVDLLSYEL